MDPRLESPRVAPLDPSEWSEAQARVLKPVFERGQVYNNLGSLARHGDAFGPLLAWGAYIINGSSLSVRARELVILRVGWLCRCQYIWRQHTVIGLREGLEDKEVARVAEGPMAAGWSDEERALLQAADEAVGDSFISADTWAALRLSLTVEQVMDIVMAAGTYAMMSALLNSLGVQLDVGFTDQDPSSVRSGLVLE